MENRVKKLINDQKWPDNIIVSEEIRTTKINICRSCEHYINREQEEMGNCDICGCDMIAFTWSKYMGTCPLGKFKSEQ